MPFDPGTNTFGFGWGNMGSWGGSSPRGGFGGGNVPNLRMPMGNISSTVGGWGDYGMGMAQNQANAAGSALKQQGQLFDQQLAERTMGLQNKYDMQRLQMQLESQRQMAMMQMFASGMALPSAEQIERSRGDLGQSLSDFAKMRDQGRYSQGEMDTLSQDAWNKINQGSMQQAQDFNNQMATSGVYASPGAAAAMRMAGQFGANAQRGAVQAGLLRENKEAMERGTMGYADISSQLADFASRPINRMANFNPFTGEGMPGFDDANPRGSKGNPLPYGNGRPAPRPGGGTQMSWSNGAPAQSNAPINIGYDDFERRRPQY